MRGSVGQDFLDPADRAIFKPDLDSAGMTARFRQDVPHNAFGEFARSLITLEHNPHRRARLNVGSLSSIHLAKGNRERSWLATMNQGG